MPECTYEGGEEHAAEGGELASWAQDKSKTDPTVYNSGLTLKTTRLYILSG